jgi:hypothetical protein
MSPKTLSGLPALLAVALIYVSTAPSYADGSCKNGHKPPCGGFVVRRPVNLPHPGPCLNCVQSPHHGAGPAIH